MSDSDWALPKSNEPVGEGSVEGRKLKSSRKASSSNLLQVMLLSSRFEVRGSSSQTLVLAENLSDYGIRSTIVTPSMRLVLPERRRTLDVREYRYLNFPFISRFTEKFIAQDFAEHPPDLIHIQSRNMLTAGMNLARRLDCPYVLTIHDYLATGELLHFDRRLGQNIIAVSASVKSELLTQPAIIGEMVKVIHSGVEYISDQLAGEILAPDRTPVIGTASPLEPIKGVSHFLHAAQMVLKEFPQVEFLVAGSGPEERSLRQLVRNLGISKHVTFVSNLYGFREPLRAMDIFCLPSLQQGLGTIMLEAMAWGRPVVASQVGGISSAIENNKTGLLVPPANSQVLADRLLMLLKNPGLAREIGDAGRVQVRKNFRIDQTVRLVADIYRSVHADFAKQKKERLGKKKTPAG